MSADAETGPEKRWVGRTVLPAILVLALGLRLAYVAGLPAGQAFRTVDARGYRALAVNLLERGTFVLDEPTPSLLDAIRTPAYPAFLAGVLAVAGDRARGVPVAQALVDTATVVVVYALGTRLAGPRRGRLAALLYAINPVSFLFIGEALSEMLLALAVAVTCLLFVLACQADRWRVGWAALAGLACGLCVLDKPNIFAAPLVLAAALLVGRRLSWRRAAEAGLLLGMALLVVLPWPVRNRVVFGEWFLSLAPEANIAHISAVATVLEANGEQAAPWTDRWEQVYMEAVVVPARIRYGWNESAAPLTIGQAVQRRHDMARVARDIIAEHRRSFVAAHVKGVLRSLVPSLHRSWYGYLAGQPWPESESLAGTLGGAAARARRDGWRAGLDVAAAWWGRHPFLSRGLWLLSAAAHVLAYGLVAAGFWALRRRPALLIGLGMVLLLFVALPGPIAYIRFWVPIGPVVCAAMACTGWRSAGVKASETAELAVKRSVRPVLKPSRR